MSTIRIHLLPFVFGACVIAGLAHSAENSTAIKVAKGPDPQSTTSKPAAQAIPESALQVQKVMNSFLGTWSVTEKYEPSESMPNGGVGHGKEVWRLGPGGFSIIEEYHSTSVAGEVAGVGVGWWDEKEQGFRVLWCENTNPKGCTLMTKVAKWEGNQFVLRDESEMMGKKTSFKEIYSDITPTSFTQTLYQGEPDGELKPFLTIQAKKLASTGTKTKP